VNNHIILFRIRLEKEVKRMSIFAADSFGALQTTLDGLNKRHQTIANNISNVDTPGYKRKSVSFRDELANALEGRENLAVTNKKHISSTSQKPSTVKPQLHTEEDTEMRNDENNVSIDAEMAHLARNTLEYQAVSKQLGDHFQRLDIAIKKGGQS